MNGPIAHAIDSQLEEVCTEWKIMTLEGKAYRNKGCCAGCSTQNQLIPVVSFVSPAEGSWQRFPFVFSAVRWPIRSEEALTS